MENRKSLYVCPKCGGHKFHTTLNVTLSGNFAIDDTGMAKLDKVENITTCEICEAPNEGMCWTCDICGYKKVGAEFATERAKTSRYRCPHCGNTRIFRATTYEAHDYVMDGDGEYISSEVDPDGSILYDPHNSDHDISCGVCDYMATTSEFEKAAKSPEHL